MYLCFCNGLSDRQLDQAIRGGARRPAEVYAACGCRAQCGRCAGTVLALIRGASAAQQDPEA
ncbi:(2Fe-2S)-binding protein [Paracraurococcus ruber]|uniref:Bacterioferritin-associated ferredoxin n=1 Tax=Paracraurococcus ruber TaxID=77675 RepID=A0ABS1CRV2_9PROT|nr:(2Fe-2S)-binding protein [Paracraurococcus ruber]MBK1656916.1 (2Fe-2S)-binding protein [Paracraurococcus ruber]TDG33292.1 (2Fe-2S)-binding protein [Paracraurococcus ruber]